MYIYPNVSGLEDVLIVKKNPSSEMTSEEFPKGKRRLSQIRKHDSKKCEKGTNMFFLNVRNHVLVLQKKNHVLSKI